MTGKITDMSEASALTGDEYVELVQGGVNVKAPVSAILAAGDTVPITLANTTHLSLTAAQALPLSVNTTIQWDTVTGLGHIDEDFNWVVPEGVSAIRVYLSVTITAGAQSGSNVAYMYVNDVGGADRFVSHASRNSTVGFNNNRTGGISHLIAVTAGDRIRLSTQTNVGTSAKEILTSTWAVIECFA